MKHFHIFIFSKGDNLWHDIYPRGFPVLIMAKTLTVKADKVALIEIEYLKQDKCEAMFVMDYVFLDFANGEFINPNLHCSLVDDRE